MLHYEQIKVELTANTETVIKEFNENYQSFTISNNSDVDVEIHMVDQGVITVESGSGIILNATTLFFEREDIPKNKIIAVSRSGVATLTVLRGV